MPTPEITPPELAARLAGPAAQRPLLLDVRFVEEHEHVALPGSVLIPLPELEERAQELERFRGHAVVVYCHHGVRSLDGAAYLRALGIEAVSLQGGIDRYSREVDPLLPRY
ncbi:rhodanese-like domain-containing protein [Stigmatella sp. ncwal1]|uniref:Rhodanese-like domain-containing protein n=1 Tax=Stigmatella ashevillensis TaxID=2995309 RepID=A0ABT5DRF9_9BACT|nr:rhodanese-like domain-containing protein [Stigmatella ashevillena]MDC0714976.1 rhodanese-like domain-containing protein [Stigmatella ashevillena]